MDTSTLGQVEPGIEPPTFRFVDNLHKPLSHCRPRRSLHVLIPPPLQMQMFEINDKNNSLKI